MAATRTPPQRVATYNIGSGTCGPLVEIFDLVAEELGEDARTRLKIGAIPYRLSEVSCMCANITRARTELGHEPRVSLCESIRRTIASYQPSHVATEHER